jgi:hypothetical protein
VKRRVAIVVLAMVFLLGAFNAWVTVPVAKGLSGENQTTVVAYRRWLIDPTTIVIDLWGVKGEASMADVDRALFKAASALKDRSYRSVVLAYKGRARFVLEGDQFKEIGQEWPDQNPIYIVRTLPAHIHALDGSSPFPEPEGGFLYVLGEQIRQHNELHVRWYLLSLVGRDPDGPIPTGLPGGTP